MRGMRNPFLVIACLLMLAITTLATPTGKTIGDVEDIPIIQGSPDDDPDSRPRTASIFSARLDTDLNILSISTLYDVGDVDAVIENLTSGEYAQYFFDSAMIANLPISGNAGFWRITLTTQHGDEYFGEFGL